MRPIATFFILLVPQIIWAGRIYFNEIDILVYRGDKPVQLLKATDLVNAWNVTDVIIEEQDLPRIFENTFRDLPLLNHITIRHCNVEKIERGAFQSTTLPKLRTINLNFNKIPKIVNGVFNKLSITKLQLIGNSIEEIEVSAFNNLPFLEVLDLSRNKLRSLRASMFVGSYNLKHINLSFNELKKLPDGFFKNPFLNALQGEDTTIDLSDNRIIFVNSKVFEGVYHVKNILLNNNLIDALGYDVFPDLDYVETVDLENNLLKTLDDNVLKQLRKANDIRLSGNSWTCLFVKKYRNWCLENNKDNTIYESSCEK